MSSPQRGPQYSGTGRYGNNRKKKKSRVPIATIFIVVLVCICFLVLSFVLLNNKDRGSSSSSQTTNVSQSSSDAAQGSSSGQVSSETTTSIASSIGASSTASSQSASSKAVSTVVVSGTVVADPLGLPAGQPCDFSFFDDAIFIGDSITNQFGIYTSKMRKSSAGFMGKARFGGVGSYSVTNALRPVTSDSKYPHHVLNGVKMQTQDFIYAKNQERPVNKAFIMFGTNDLNLYKTYSDYLVQYKKYIDRITEKNPQLKIYLMATTPVTKAYSDKYAKGKLNQKGIDAFNLELKKFCAQNGYGFVNTNSILRDSYGCMPAEWASSDGFHPNDIGYGKLVETIRVQVG